MFFQCTHVPINPVCANTFKTFLFWFQRLNLSKDNHVHIPVQKHRHVPVHVPVEKPVEAVQGIHPHDLCGFQGSMYSAG